MEHQDLTRRVIGAAMRVHGTLGPGFLESVYQHALAWELRLGGAEVDCERRLQVRYRDMLVGDFVADMVVDGTLLVENKALRAIDSAHAAQVINYLKATGLQVGLLVNFGAPSLEVRRFAPKDRTAYRDYGDYRGFGG